MHSTFHTLTCTPNRAQICISYQVLEKVPMCSSFPRCHVTGSHFGSVTQDVLKAPYQVNDTVMVTFQSACPRNNVRTGDTFLAVQKLQDDTGEWTTVSPTYCCCKSCPVSRHHSQTFTQLKNFLCMERLLLKYWHAAADSLASQHWWNCMLQAGRLRGVGLCVLLLCAGTSVCSCFGTGPVVVLSVCN